MLVKVPPNGIPKPILAAKSVIDLSCITKPVFS